MYCRCSDVVIQNRDMNYVRSSVLHLLLLCAVRVQTAAAVREETRALSTYLLLHYYVRAIYTNMTRK